MKKVVNLIVFVLVGIYIADYVKKENSTKSVSPIYIPESQESQTYENTDDGDRQVSEKPTSKRNQTVYVRALGNVDDGDLEFASNVIENFYGYNVEIISSVDIENGMLNTLGELHSVNTCASLHDDIKTIYITDKLLYDENNVLLRGVASGNELTVVVRGEKRFMQETIIHELGHTFGLPHCSDRTCIMATHNDDYDSGDFCNNCKSKIRI